jgi:RHS repeat-associated protein
MISSTNTSTDVTTTYTYDYRNRLTEVTTGGTVVEKYTYNALNQRIGVKDSGTQTWTIFDGTSPDANPYADFNGSGSLTEHYLFGPGVVNGAVMTSILARTSSGGTTAWYLTDNLGSVRDIVSTSGSELDHIVYDSFGNIVTETDAANGDRFKFAGMQYDAITGQYYDHARWYGPTQGRFLSEDPDGFGAGDPNLFRYVGNGPTFQVDTGGMFAQSLNPIAGGGTVLVLTGVVLYFMTQQLVAQHQGVLLDIQIAAARMQSQLQVMNARLVAMVMAGVAATSLLNATVPVPSLPFPGEIPPDQAPGPGFEWRPVGTMPGSTTGNWFNPATGESLWNDMQHPPPIGPHWDYGKRGGKGRWRWFPGGGMEPK